MRKKTVARRASRVAGLILVLAAYMTCLPNTALVEAGESPAKDDSKVDEGINLDATTMQPVFVRMTDQLFRAGGEYEAFAKDHENDKRSDLRQHVLSTLREKAEGSWKTLSPVVDELAQKEELRGVERFWIVNGFACEATPTACCRLAESEDVSFVYLQRGPLRQHKQTAKVRPIAARRGLSVEQKKQACEQVLADWRDDTDEPFSAEGLTIPWNLKRIQADVAGEGEKATGKGVVIALCDTGLMVAPPLARALWRNADEELNGKDDDGNGFVDDLFGYDFTADSFYALGDGGFVTHGSMCGGIMAGRSSKSKLITGVAPRAKLMVLCGMGYLKAYEYALANGADIISMSYMWIRTELGHYRGVYRTAHEHMAAGGIVAVGGAGNFSRFTKGKQIALPKDIPCVIAAAGILEDGSKAPMGSEGPCYWDGVKFYDDYGQDDPLMKADAVRAAKGG